jgi:uncharacterized membrane protein (GlpM family)
VCELAVRFLLGAVVVSSFSALGEVWRPRTFAGLFGAAPSVALVSLAVVLQEHGAREAVLEATTMVLGSVAMVVYASACVVATRRARVPVWAGVGLAWTVWLATAFALFAMFRVGGGP